MWWRLPLTARKLGRKEYDILVYLMHRPNRMIEKEMLAEAVWGDHIDQSDNFGFVYAQMKNLRKEAQPGCGVYRDKDCLRIRI